MAVVFPLAQFEAFTEQIPRLSEAEYLSAVRLFAPDRDVRETDIELTSFYTTYVGSLCQSFETVRTRVMHQTRSFRSIILDYDQEFPNGLDVNGNLVPEPESVAISRMGLRVSNALSEYTIDLFLGPRDFRRMKLTFLIVQTLRATGPVDSLDMTGLPNALEVLCDTFARLDILNHPSLVDASSTSNDSDSLNDMQSTDDDIHTNSAEDNTDIDTTDDASDTDISDNSEVNRLVDAMWAD
ncbi:hypothetical protein FRC10_003490 [Ceratobasidium sp. 414]|nr:hypothetical protein FRC10_003490 [Ceratobasidium sp. 414]